MAGGGVVRERQNRRGEAPSDWPGLNRKIAPTGTPEKPYPSTGTGTGVEGRYGVGTPAREGRQGDHSAGRPGGSRGVEPSTATPLPIQMVRIHGHRDNVPVLRAAAHLEMIRLRKVASRQARRTVVLQRIKRIMGRS